MAEGQGGAPSFGCGAAATVVAANIIINKASSSPGESSNEGEHIHASRIGKCLPPEGRGRRFGRLVGTVRTDFDLGGCRLALCASDRGNADSVTCV